MSTLKVDAVVEKTDGAGVTIDGVKLKDGVVTGDVSGNADTATTLETARAINGVDFDGSSPITVTADANTLTGTTLKSTVVNSSLQNLGVQDEDLDLNNYYLIRNQTTLDSWPHPYWNFNGDDQNIVVPDDAELDFGTGDFSVLAFFKTSKTYSTSGHLVSKISTGVGYQFYMFTGDQVYMNINTGTSYTVNSTDTVNDGNFHAAIVTLDRDGYMKLYVDGSEVDSIDISAGDGVSLSNAVNLRIGSNYLETTWYTGERGATRLFNRVLTPAEIKKYSNPLKALDFVDIGGSNTEQTSGTLTIGKSYRINTYVAGDDFTNIGGTNVTGNEFTATGTTPTTWTNSSALVPIGCTFELDPRNSSKIQAKDSQSGNHGLLSDETIPQNAPVSPRHTDIYKSVADNDTFSVPANCVEMQIIIDVLTQQAGTTMRIGTSDGGQQVVADVATTSTGIIKAAMVLDYFKAGDTLYIGSDGGAAWVALDATVHVSYSILDIN